MQYPEDVKVAQMIARQMKTKPIVLNDEYTTSELLSIVGNLDLLIGVRLHADKAGRWREGNAVCNHDFAL